MRNIGVIIHAENPLAWHAIHAKPAIWYSSAFFLELPEVSQIAIVTSTAYMPQALAIAQSFSQDRIVACERQGDKTAYCQSTAARSWPVDVTDICIHDGTWLLSSSQQMQRLLAMLEQQSIVVAAVPLKETLKETDAQRIIQRTPDRSTLWKIQSPLCIRRNVYDSLVLDQRDARRIPEYLQLLAALGQTVAIAEGEYANIELTSPDDCRKAEAQIAT